jgi:hypothetical protein
MIQHLVVLKPFLNFVRGDIIPNAEKIREVLDSEYRKFITKVAPHNAPKG